MTNRPVTQILQPMLLVIFILPMKVWLAKRKQFFCDK